MKERRIRTAAVLMAGALVISMALTSCTALMKEASLGTSVSGNGAVLPTVKGFVKSSSINGKLSDEFLPLAERMEEIVKDSDGRLNVDYRMTEIKSGLLGGEYSVAMYISDGTENEIELKSVTLSGLDTVKPDSGNNAEWLSSADIAESALVMQRYGVEIDYDTLGEFSTERNTIETFITLYEGFAGKETDISSVTVSQDDPLTQKALLLELIDYYGEPTYYYDEKAIVYRVADIANKTLNAIERDVYGRQSETVTGKEFAAMVRTQYNVIRVQEPDEAETLWSDLGKVDMEAILSGMDITGDPFNRRDAAELLERITKEGPKFSMNYGDNNLELIDDARESIWVRRAVTHGFMNYYGNSVIFAPWEGLTVTNAISTAKCYISARYNDWAYSRNYKWDGYYTNEDVIIAAAKVAEFFGDRTDADKDFEVRTVMNDRDYDWFFSQKNTGEYSDINCMPSIATMASHWYDSHSKATVKKMRATSDYDDGWTAFELRGGLAAYNVPYYVEDATYDNIIKALDSGNIVLAQYSDRKTGRFGVSGHCYVIYGYRKFKDSTTFIVNDSDSLTRRAEIFGRKMGNGDEVEGSFSIWTITRFVSDITVVTPNDTNN